MQLLSRFGKFWNNYSQIILLAKQKVLMQRVYFIPRIVLLTLRFTTAKNVKFKTPSVTELIELKQVNTQCDYKINICQYR
jgi:hypothetical protein